MNTPRYPLHRGRQFFLAGAITIFVIISTIMLLSTAGWAWDNNARQLIQLSSLYLSSSPRADIYLDGQKFGSTPARLFRLSPGNYQITLTRPGYVEWQTTRELTAGRASTLPNVKLFPVVVPEKILTISGNTRAVVDDNGSRAWVVLPENGDYKIISGHDRAPDYFTLPFAPQTIYSGPHNKYLIAQNANSAQMIAIDHSGINWPIPTIQGAAWSSETDATIFGIHDQQLLKIDYLRQTVDYLGPATSLFKSGALLWYTTDHDNRTSLWRRDESATFSATAVQQLDGHWVAENGTANSVIIKNIVSGEGVLVTGNLTTGFHSHHLGTVNKTFGTNPFIWQGATDFKTFIDDQAVLIDRVPRSTVWADWFSPNRIIVSSDGTAVKVYDLDHALNRGVIASFELPTDTKIIGSLADHHGFWFQSKAALWTWSWSSN
jgi:hypothetical protein